MLQTLKIRQYRPEYKHIIGHNYTFIHKINTNIQWPETESAIFNWFPDGSALPSKKMCAESLKLSQKV